METDRRLDFIVFPDDDYLDDFWEKEDPLLKAITHDFFKDRVRWCDLSPVHYRFLIIETMKVLTKLDDPRFRDEDDEVVKNLKFLLCGLVRSTQDVTDALVEFIKIDRLNDGEVLFNFTMSANMLLELSRKPKKGLKVVVDNG
jgi:hypothetical protein